MKIVPMKEVPLVGIRLLKALNLMFQFYQMMITGILQAR